MAREDVERLVRIETKLDAVLSRSVEDRAAVEAEIVQIREEHLRDVQAVKHEHDTDVEKLTKENDDLTKRVGSLENWRYAVGAALLMSSASAIGAAINIVPK